jgi:myo-inositol 2-dehydrogenase / D-chiro-inositol 1-dehydrogenase
MSICIGVIGAGVMGSDHARIIARETGGAPLVAISDYDIKRAEAVGAENGAGRCIADPMELIVDKDVDAVPVASPDHTHTAFSLACLKVGKPVLCEKPLAPTTQECPQILAAEGALGKRGVQVGFMPPFRPGLYGNEGRPPVRRAR